ncbi:MAG: SAM-dependent methyltransferase, partial [Pseudomonadota bacterium]
MVGRLNHRMASALLALFVSACGGASDDADELPPPAYGIDETANTDLWLETMEVGSRELFSARDAVVAAVALKKGERIADVGAGTGLYSLMFAESV